jgi:RimJ/RimL family protein N-acetyltransferase
MDPQPITLVGRHVRLEPLTPGHVPALFAALHADSSIWQWFPLAPPETPADMEALIRSNLEAQAQGQVVVFVQVETTARQVVGSTSYLNISRRDRGLEIGSTWLGKPWQRTGINTEAKYLLLTHAFERLGAARVQLKTDARNLQSQAAIQRLGAVREGVLRKHMLVRDGFIRNTVMYSIVAPEWPAVKARLQEMMARYDSEGSGAGVPGSDP